MPRLCKYKPLHAKIRLAWPESGLAGFLDILKCDGILMVQIIFKAITGSSGHAFWWELHSMETVV